MLISIYTTRIILKALGVTDYGIHNVVAGFVSMFAFLNTAMSGSIQRFYNYHIGKYGSDSINHTFTLALLVQAILALIILIITESVGLWYMKHYMVMPADRINAAFWVFHCSVSSLVLTVLQVPFMAAVMAFERINFFAALSILDAVLKLAISFFILNVPDEQIDRLKVYGTLLLGISVFNIVTYAGFSLRTFKSLRFSKVIDLTQLKEMLSFSGWSLFGVFAFMVRSQGVNMVLNMFFGPVVNAARGLSNQINYALSQFSSSIFTASRPQIVEAYASSDYKRTITLFYACSKLSFYLLLIFSVPVILEIDYILQLWLGQNVPVVTASFTILVIIISLISNFHTVLTTMFQATGRVKWFNLVSFAFISSTVPVSYLCLKEGMAAISVYYASIVMTTLCVAVCLVLLNRIVHFGLRRYLLEVIIPAALIGGVAIVPGVLIREIMEIGIVRFLAVFAISTISIGLLVFFIGIGKYEKEWLQNLVRTKFLKKHC